jgi:hypothetical protein
VGLALSRELGERGRERERGGRERDKRVLALRAPMHWAI